MNQAFTPGCSREEEVIVGAQHCTFHAGPGMLSTPSMVFLMEAVCVRMAEPYLEEGQVTVGTHIDVAHDALASLGETINVSARLATREGRRLEFDVWAHRGDIRVGGGRHVRAIVQSGRYSPSFSGAPDEAASPPTPYPDGDRVGYGRRKLYSASDLYGFEELLADAEVEKLAALRALLATRLRPVLPDYWERAESPVFLREPLRDLRLLDAPGLVGRHGEPRGIYNGFRAFEFSRVDIGTGMLYHGQVGMFRELVRQGGSPDQVAAWDADILSFRMTGCFALTEPEHGSDVARGLETTARRVGDLWVLDGAKRWIGNAAHSDYVAVFARDVADQQVKVFLARTDATGLELTKIERKTALRTVTNSDISLRGVEVPDSHRLQRVSSFADVSALFRTLRPDVAWIAAGAQAGAYEAALAYTTKRKQFGRPLASFQLVQDKLVRMLGNVTASLAMAVRLAERREGGVSRDEDSALAKLWIADRLRETVALGRELVGGNGIVADFDVARFFSDAEAVYTYEGTRDINTLVVGRAVTGYSAFVR